MKINEKILLYKVYTKKDTEAFAALYDLYIARIYRFVRLKVSHTQEAEDLTSDIFLKTWNYLTDGKEKQIQSFSGLIYKIARNTIIDWYREKPKRLQDPIDQAHMLEGEHSLEEETQLKQEYASVLDHIAKLKQEYQEIILLRYVEEQSIAEIADIIGKKKTAVRVTLHRAMKKLKEFIDHPA